MFTNYYSFFKNYFLAFACALLITNTASSQTVPLHYFGANGWMPDFVGSLNLGGKFYDIINSSSTNLITTSGVRIVRLGGSKHDKNFITHGSSTSQAETFVTTVRAIGMEPLIQVPFIFNLIPYPSGNPSVQTAISNALNTTYEAQVKSLITDLSASPYNVHYWSIANEPDQYFPKGIIPTAITAQNIYTYFWQISDWIRDIDPNAIIVGPDLAESQAYSQTSGLAFDLLTNSSYKISGPSSAHSGKYYMDIFAFHIYPHDGTQSRANVISEPSGGFTNSLTNIRYFINSIGRNSNLQMAVTELNVSHDNNGPSDDQPNGVGDQNCNSFLAGQWMAEMFAVGLDNPGTSAKMAFMTPWELS